MWNYLRIIMYWLLHFCWALINVGVYLWGIWRVREAFKWWTVFTFKIYLFFDEYIFIYLFFHKCVKVKIITHWFTRYSFEYCGYIFLKTLIQRKILWYLYFLEKIFYNLLFNKKFFKNYKHLFIGWIFNGWILPHVSTVHPSPQLVCHVTIFNPTKIMVFHVSVYSFYGNIKKSSAILSFKFSYKMFDFLNLYSHTNFFEFYKNSIQLEICKH